MGEAFLMGQNGNGGSLKIVEGTVQGEHSSIYVETVDDYWYDIDYRIYNNTDIFQITHTKNINNLYLQFSIKDYNTVLYRKYLDNPGVPNLGIIIDSNFANKSLYTAGLWTGRSLNTGDPVYDTINGYNVPGYSQFGYLTPLVIMTVNGIGTNSVTITFTMNNVAAVQDYDHADVFNMSYKILG